MDPASPPATTPSSGFAPESTGDGLKDMKAAAGEDGRILSLLRDFNEAYECRLRKLSSSSSIQQPSSPTLDGAWGKREGVLREWVRDLCEQNELLVCSLQEVQHASESRVRALQEKMERDARGTRSCMVRLRDLERDGQQQFAERVRAQEEAQSLRMKLETLQRERLQLKQDRENLRHDVGALLLFIRRAQTAGCWDIRDINFMTVTPCQLAEIDDCTHALLRSPSEWQDMERKLSTAEMKINRLKSDVKQLWKAKEDRDLRLIDKDKTIANLETEVAVLTHHITMKVAQFNQHLHCIQELKLSLGKEASDTKCGEKLAGYMLSKLKELESRLFDGHNAPASVTKYQFQKLRDRCTKAEMELQETKGKHEHEVIKCQEKARVMQEELKRMKQAEEERVESETNRKLNGTKELKGSQREAEAISKNGEGKELSPEETPVTRGQEQSSVLENNNNHNFSSKGRSLREHSSNAAEELPTHEMQKADDSDSAQSEQSLSYRVCKEVDSHSIFELKEQVRHLSNQVEEKSTLISELQEHLAKVHSDPTTKTSVANGMQTIGSASCPGLASRGSPGAPEEDPKLHETLQIKESEISKQQVTISNLQDALTQAKRELDAIRRSKEKDSNSAGERIRVLRRDLNDKGAEYCQHLDQAIRQSETLRTLQRDTEEVTKQTGSWEKQVSDLDRDRQKLSEAVKKAEGMMAHQRKNSHTDELLMKVMKRDAEMQYLHTTNAMLQHKFEFLEKKIELLQKQATLDLSREVMRTRNPRSNGMDVSGSAERDTESESDPDMASRDPTSQESTFSPTSCNCSEENLRSYASPSAYVSACVCSHMDRTPGPMLSGPFRNGKPLRHCNHAGQAVNTVVHKMVRSHGRGCGGIRESYEGNEDCTCLPCPACSKSDLKRLQENGHDASNRAAAFQSTISSLHLQIKTVTDVFDKNMEEIQALRNELARQSSEQDRGLKADQLENQRYRATHSCTNEEFGKLTQELEMAKCTAEKLSQQVEELKKSQDQEEVMKSAQAMADSVGKLMTAQDEEFKGKIKSYEEKIQNIEHLVEREREVSQVLRDELQQLQTMLEDKNAKLAGTTDALAHLRSEVERVKENCKCMENKAAEESGMRVAMEKSIEEYAEKLGRDDEELAKERKAREKMELEVTRLTRELERKTKELEDMATKLETVQKVAAREKEASQYLMQEVERLKEDVSERDKQIRQSVEGMEFQAAEVIKLRGQCRCLEDEARKMKEESGKVDPRQLEQVLRLTAALKEKEAELKRLQGDVSSLGDEHRKEDAEIGRLQSKVLQLEQARSKSMSDSDEAKRKIHTLELTIKDLEGHITQQNAEISKLNVSLKQKDDSGLRRQLLEKEKELVSMEKKAKAQEERSKEQMAQFSIECECKGKAYKEKEEELNRKVDVLQADLNDMMKHEVEISQEILRIGQQRDQAVEELMKMQNKMDQQKGQEQRRHGSHSATEHRERHANKEGSSWRPDVSMRESWTPDTRMWQACANGPAPEGLSQALMDNCECDLTLQTMDVPTTGDESGFWSPSSSRHTPRSMDLDESNQALDSDKLLSKVEALAMELKMTNEYWKSKLRDINLHV